MAFLQTYLDEVSSLLGSIDIREVARGRKILKGTADAGGTVFTVGNGGSAATASHFACDLFKRTGIKTRSLVDPTALVTALANDLDYASVFSWQVEREMGPRDCLVAISASGNSPNVLHAVAKAKALGGKTVGLVGFDGGALKGMVDCPIWLRSENMEQIEDAHLVLCHLLACCLRREKP